MPAWFATKLLSEPPMTQIFAANIFPRLQSVNWIYSAESRNGPYIWWRHQKENISALLAPCEGNPSVTSEFLSQRPVTRNFEVFFGLRLNKRFSKQSRRRRFETPSRLLRRHCNATVRIGAIVSDNISSPLIIPVKLVEFTLVWENGLVVHVC